MLESVCSPSECVMPMAATPKMGMPTAVTIKPMMAGMTFRPASWPRWTGKIRLPAPKNIPNNVPATRIFCRMVNFFTVMENSSFWATSQIAAVSYDVILLEGLEKVKRMIIIDI